MAMKHPRSLLTATSILALVAACSEGDLITKLDRETGLLANSDLLGSSVQNNIDYQTGAKTYAVELGERFNREVPDTVTFAFNSATLDAQARSILARQANFIRQFPEVRFRVYGHTDLVGSAAYNKNLGLRRARAVVNFFSSQGISTSRLEAMASYGETQPVVNTPDREQRNRRTVTEVSGFVEDNPLILNGKYAEVVWREYTESATQIQPLGEGDSGGGGGGVNNAAISGGGGGGAE